MKDIAIPVENEEKPAKDIPTLFTVEEVAAHLRIGRNSAYNLVKSGRIKHVKIGRTIRIPKSAVLDFIGGIPGEIR